MDTVLWDFSIRRMSKVEKNEVTSAKAAVSISKKEAKKARKKAKKAAKKAEKRERKDIKSAYTKALRKGNTDKMLAILAIMLTVAPIIAEFVMDKLNKKDSNKQ